jgi:hypothetical protein
MNGDCMKVVNLEEFKKLPVGTVFQKYTPNIFGILQVKDENFSHYDFYSCSLTEDLKGNDNDTQVMEAHNKLQNGEDVEKCFNTYDRDGLYKRSQLYAIWSKSDIRGLIGKLQQSL